MEGAFRDHEPLARLKVNGPAFKVDDEVAVQYEKELVVIVVLVPVILTLQNPQPDDRLVYLAQRLVVPRISAGLYQGRDIDD
jgi:hypothetical protein